MTPDANPKQTRRRPPMRRPFSPIWLGVGLFGLLLVIQVVAAVVRQGQSLNYSDFKARLAQNQIAEVVISKDTISGKFQEADGSLKSFNTARVEDPDLVKELSAQKVRYWAEPQTEWLAQALTWVLPALLIIGLWILLFRRMGGAEGGIMSFARSRAKIYAEDDVKVSFADVAGVDEAEQELREIVEFLKNPSILILAADPKVRCGPQAGCPRAGRQQSPFSPGIWSHRDVWVRAACAISSGAVAGTLHRLIDLLTRSARCACVADGRLQNEQTLNQLLVEMDPRSRSAIIMAATNRPGSTRR